MIQHYIRQPFIDILKTVKLLVDRHHADISIENADGKTALSLLNEDEIVEALKPLLADKRSNESPSIRWDRSPTITWQRFISRLNLRK